MTYKSQTRNVDLDIDFSRDELIMVSGENDESKEVLCSSEHWNRLATVHMWYYRCLYWSFWFVFVWNSICIFNDFVNVWCWFSYHASTERGSSWHAMQGQVSPSECKSKRWCDHKGHYPRNGEDLVHYDISLWV